MEFPVFDGLKTNEGGDGDNVVHRATAGNISDRAGEAHENLAVGFSSGEEMDEFDGDIAAVEIRKYEHVRLSSNMGCAELELGDRGIQSGVRLHFALDGDFGIRFLGDVAGEFDGTGDLFRGRGACTSFGGKAEHRDAWAFSEDLTGKQACLDGDGGELLHRWIRDDARVRKEEHPVVPELFVLKLHEGAGGNHIREWHGFDQMKQGAKERAAGGVDASSHGVGESVLDHHGSEVGGASHDFGAVFEACLAVALDALEALAKDGKFGGCGGVDDRDVVEIDAMRGSDMFDDVAAAEEDGNSQIPLVKPFRGPYHGFRLSVGKDDSFRMPPKFFKNSFNEPHTL